VKEINLQNYRLKTMIFFMQTNDVSFIS